MSTLVQTIKGVQNKAEELQIKDGVYAIPHLVDSWYAGDNLFLKQYREKGYVGKIVYAPSPEQMAVNPSANFAVSLLFPECEIGPQRTQAISIKAIRVVSNKDADPILEKMKEGRERAVKEAKAKVEEITSGFKRLPVAKREDFVLSDKLFLNTNFNYVKLYVGKLNEDGKPTTPPSLYPSAVCCALTKTPHNIYVTIPKAWINYYGYTTTDVKMWLKFLAGCETGFKGFIFSESTMGQEFPNNITDQIPVLPNNNMFITRDMECINIMIPTTGDNHRNYMHFLLLRYMYNLQYWNIPTIALQIKRALGDDITNWEALLIAHMNHPYNGYYALVSNTVSASALPIKANSQEVVLKKIGASMNGAFHYDSTYKVEPIREAIRKKDYDFILKELQAFRERK